MSKVQPIPAGYHSLIPYLTVKGAADAIEFYKKAFGATETRRMEAPGGKITHAELRIGDSILMLSDEFPEMGGKSPAAAGGSPVHILLYIDGVDQVVEHAVAAGARLKRPVQDQFYGDRMGTLTDPFGHEWYIATHVEDMTDDEMRRRGEAFMKESSGKMSAA